MANFRKRIKIAPGINLNVSKSGLSTLVGGKKLLLLVIFSYNTLPSIAQLKIEPNNFYWQRVIEYSGSVDEMHNRIITSGIYKDIQKNDSTIIIGRVENIVLNYATMDPEPRLANKPIFFRNREKFSGTLIYELKEDRYRVTFKDLIYDSEMLFNVGAISVDMRNKPVNDLFYKEDGRFCRGEKAQEFARKVFDFSFSNSFIIKNDNETPSDDW